MTEKEELENTLQQRADYIPIEKLFDETYSNGPLFSELYKALLNKSLRTIVGPRGCGKTHLMRYTWLKCLQDNELPFAIFASFNKYFRLEPLLSKDSGALQKFHSWVLARVLMALLDSVKEWQIEINQDKFLENYDLSATILKDFIRRIERNQSLDDNSLDLSQKLSIELVQEIIDASRLVAKRKYTILLMDDAALTLTPDYLMEFLDIVRSLKSITIVPKISVYPGTTEVSPKFHQGHDSIAVPAWLSVEDPSYYDAMQNIGEIRVPQIESIPEEINMIFQFAAFGIPRAYLTMLDEFLRSQFRTAQQGANKIIDSHFNARLDEFISLGKKVPKLRNLVHAGEIVLNSIARELKQYNYRLLPKKKKGLAYGITKDEITPIIGRMFKLLAEAGLMYNLGNVKHGTPERIYHRYIPHTSLLLHLGIFNTESSSSKHLVSVLKYKSTKHPLRRKLLSIAKKANLDDLKFSLPICTNCGTKRIEDNQRFCHSCGHQLVDASTFNKCLSIPIKEVPGLTEWQQAQIRAHLPKLKTIGDFLAHQDPGAELLSVRGFGVKRTAKIIDILNGFVDDYLS